jgi:hypothetical protein
MKKRPVTVVLVLALATTLAAAGPLVHQAERDADRAAGRIVPQDRYELGRIGHQDDRVADQVLADAERQRELAQAGGRDGAGGRSGGSADRAGDRGGDASWREAQRRSEIQSEITRERVRAENDRAIRQEIRAGQQDVVTNSVRRQQDLVGRELLDDSLVRDRQLERELAAQRQAIEAERGVDVAGDPSPLAGSDAMRQMVREEVARALAEGTATTQPMTGRVPATQRLGAGPRREEAIRLIREATDERDRDLAAIGPGTTDEARGYRESAERKYTNRLRDILQVYGFGEGAGATTRPVTQ